MAPDGVTVVGEPSRTLFTIDKRQIRIPKTMNLSGGIEQALPWNFHFRANYLRKRGHSGYTFAFEDNPAIAAQSLPANGLPIRRLYQLENSEQEKYDSVDLSFENQFLKKYTFWFLAPRSRPL